MNITIQTLGLAEAILRVMNASLAEANKGNPFVSKAEAMRSINEARAFQNWVHVMAVKSLGV